MAGNDLEGVVVQPPSSVSWVVHVSRALWVGGVRGLMLQALHPSAMRGVWQNSDFREDPVGRLLRTADFVGRVTFGSPQEAEAVGQRVQRVHRGLRVREPGGRVSRVDEPELLLWVHCAEVVSYLETVVRAGVGLSRGQADRYLFEQRRSASYVGLREEDVPGSVAQMREYFRGVRGRLEVTPEAAAAVRFLVSPALPESLRHLRLGKPLYWPFGALCYYTLPRWARRMYGFLPPVPDAAVTVALRGFRQALEMVPETVYEKVFMPGTREMLDGARERLAAAGYDMSGGLRGLRDPRRWP
ncbi:oxygenase MpaB family protein [Sphaerisporangium sp. B11E5]|uniref:oxygenase MpaB family protein n=1 Tax=Sphaerisporangium sp. B11E5 TaxID=3153563 RepID=UPI00325F7824